ncbi:predicted protein [Naegleria gruberi]|uniref:Predicted protein n=1 Tax=Naegleria gruberi TaxID=5762 RepID=D2W1Q0_NAEGR|nr:uncharacterized protein NAEGRDRAFT_75334 [Naegleria gruberi]EFC36959.1 predicted protein [Naegleria gruberi]|eukprot:XP_002669703.1 predicted protein [Naegleria gruberi strain NEG-M]
MSLSKDNFVIETECDDDKNIVSNGRTLTIHAIRSSYYDHMVETDIEEVKEINLQSLTSFKDSHFPNVPIDGFYSILMSLVNGEYSSNVNDYLIDYGIDGFFRNIEKSKEKVMKLYKDHHFDDSLLLRTLKCKNIELTENLMKKGHILTLEQMQNITKNIKNVDSFTVLFTCKYLKFNNIDFNRFLPDVESILDSTPEVCEIFIEEKIVECPDVLIDIVNETTHVNYPALQYLKQVKPSLICPLDTRSIKKKGQPKILILFENPAHEKEQKYLYSSMTRITCKIFPQSLDREKVLNNLTEKCSNMDVILFRPKTFSEDKLKETLELIQKATINTKPIIGIVCFYSNLSENKQALREVFRAVRDVYLIIEIYPCPPFSQFTEIFYCNQNLCNM